MIAHWYASTKCQFKISDSNRMWKKKKMNETMKNRECRRTKLHVCIRVTNKDVCNHQISVVRSTSKWQIGFQFDFVDLLCLIRRIINFPTGGKTTIFVRNRFCFPLLEFDFHNLKSTIWNANNLMLYFVVDVDSRTTDIN